MDINYVVGDATNPMMHGSNKAAKVICHICNDIGGWGRGFVLALNARFGGGSVPNSPEWNYRKWHKDKYYIHGASSLPFVLGQIQIVPVSPEGSISVCNMIAQRSTDGLYECGVRLPLPNVNYTSLYECFNRLLIRLRNPPFESWDEVEIHAPKLGCGLGGGKWPKVENIINTVFQGTTIDVYVYDMP